MNQTNRLTTLWLCGILACFSSAYGQTTIIAEHNVTQPLSATPPQQVHLFGILPSGDRVAVVFANQRTSSSPGSAAQVVIIRPDGSTKEHSLPNVLPEPMGIVGSKIIFTALKGPRMAPGVFDIYSGQVKALSDDITPVLLSTGGADRLALAGGLADGRVALRIFGPDLAVQASYIIPGYTQAQLLGSLLSFAGPDKLLLINRTGASYVTMHLGSQLKLDQPVTLQGSEIELSKSWPATRQTRLREVVVLAHVLTTNGKNLFFLGPFRKAEGYRAAEFDDAGQQVAAYRFEVPGAGRDQPVSFRDRTLASRDGKLRLLTTSGVERLYRMP